jgi:hypothetical protein
MTQVDRRRDQCWLAADDQLQCRPRQDLCKAYALKRRQFRSINMCRIRPDDQMLFAKKEIQSDLAGLQQKRKRAAPRGIPDPHDRISLQERCTHFSLR